MTFILLAYQILYFSESLALSYFAIMLFGMGVGITYLGPVRTAWYYFPNHKGLVTGTILCGFGISAAFLDLGIQRIINPSGLKPNSFGFYPDEISQMVPSYILTAFFVFAILGLISICLICPYEKDNTPTRQDLDRIPEDDSIEISIEIKSVSVKNKINDSFRDHYVSALLSRKYLALFSLTLFCSCKVLFISRFHACPYKHSEKLF